MVAITLLSGCSAYSLSSDASFGDVDTALGVADPGELVEGDPGSGIPDQTEAWGSRDLPADELIESEDAEEDSAETKYVWEQVGLPFPKDYVFKDVDGRDPNRVFLVGAGPIAYAFDGQHFEDMHPPPIAPVLNGVYAAPDEDVWMVGALGGILHWHGSFGAGGCEEDADCASPDPCFEGKCVQGSCQYEHANEPGCCGYPSLEADFDDGTLQGFTVEDLYSPPAGGVVWNVFSHVDSESGTPRYTSPPYALFFGNPDVPCPGDPSKTCPNFANDDKPVGADAISPLLKLPNARTVSLTFEVFTDVEESDGYDVFKVYVQTLDGQRHEVFDKSEIGGNTGQKFHKAAADLTQFAGQEVHLVFHFDSVDSFANNTEGVYLDDIVVNSECGEAGKPKNEWPTLFSVSGSANGQVYAVGLHGAVIRLAGDKWVPVGVWGKTVFSGICPTAKGVMVVGERGTVLVSNESGVLGVEGPVGDSHFKACANGQLIVGEDGTIDWRTSEGDFKQIDASTKADLYDVVAFSDGSFLAVGELGLGVFVKDDDVTKLSIGAANLYAVDARSKDDIWVVGKAGSAFHGKGLAFDDVPTTTNSDLYDVAALDNGDAVAVGKDGALQRYSLFKKQWFPIKTGTTLSLYGVYMEDAGHGWIVGQIGTVLRYEENQVTKVDSPIKADLYGITSDGERLWAAGDSVVLVRDDGQDAQWRIAFSATDVDLRDVYVLDDDHVYVVGKSGRAFVCNEHGCVRMMVEELPAEGGGTVMFSQAILGVWAADDKNVVAVSEAGTWLLWDATESLFRVYASDTSSTLRAVHGTSEHDFFMVGGEGTILHYTDGNLVQEEAFPISTLYGVVAFDDGTAWAVGDTGTVLLRRKLGK